MTELLDRALSAARSLPSEAQDEIARIVLQLADSGSPLVLSDDERIAIDASKAAAAGGDFATDDEVRAAWAKHGL